jgi:hypothetical protein
MSTGARARVKEVHGVSPASRTLALIVVAVVLAACGGAVAPPAPGATPDVTVPAATPMPAGIYTTAAFQPALTFTVPDGWELAADTPSFVQMRPAGSQNTGIYLFRDAFALSQDPTCPTTAEPGVGTTSTELTTWLRGLPGLVASSPAMVTVGGLRGTSLDLAIKADWTESCPFANGLPTVPLIRNDGIERWVLAGSERLRFYILDVPGGGNVIVDVDDFEGSQIDALIKEATPIIRSFQFATE